MCEPMRGQYLGQVITLDQSDGWDCASQCLGASPGHESHSRDREEELEPGFRETSVSFSRTIVLSKTLLQSLFHPSFNLSRPVYWCSHIRCLDAGWRMKGVVTVVISDNINISSRASCLQCRALCLVVTGNLRTDGHLATEKLGHT